MALVPIATILLKLTIKIERLTRMPFHRFIFNNLAEACDAADLKAQALGGKVFVLPCEFHNTEAYLVTERFTATDNGLEPIYSANYSALDSSG